MNYPLAKPHPNCVTIDLLQNFFEESLWSKGSHTPYGSNPARSTDGRNIHWARRDFRPTGTFR
jgi:hypothetical protein